jgi:hypothetical protein
LDRSICEPEITGFIIIIIIIITWRYSPTWALASCAIRLHWSLSWAFLLHPSILISRREITGLVSKYDNLVLVAEFCRGKKSTTLSFKNYTNPYCICTTAVIEFFSAINFARFWIQISSLRSTQFVLFVAGLHQLWT